MSSIKYEDTILLKEKIRSRISIRDIMLDHGVELIDHPGGSKGMACCPFHDDRSPSFSVDYVRGLYNCFSCHESGDLFTFISKKHEFSKWEETIEYICSNYGISINKDGKLSLDDEARKILLLTSQKNIVNSTRHRDEFDRIILIIYQKIKYCLDIKKADSEFVKKVVFPIFRDIDESIESDKFDFIRMEDLSCHLDKIIDKLRSK